MDLRPRRAAVLAHRHRLDHGAVGDRRHARQRRDARALRRRARPPRSRPAVVDRRAPPRHDPRRVADAGARADGARRRRRSARTTCRRCASWGRPASRGTKGRGVVLRRRRRRPLPGDQHLGRHRGRRVLPLAARRAAAVAVLARRARARDGGRRVRRRRPLGAGRGRRARVHEAVAGDDTRLVARPRALPRDVLVALAGRLVARRLRERDRRRPVVPARPFGRHDQGRGQAARSGRGRDRARRVIPRCSRRPRSACPTSSRASRCGCTSSCVPASTPTTRCARSSVRASPSTSVRRSGPSAVRFTDALPKTRSAKVLRRAIRAVATGDSAGRPLRPRGSGGSRCDRGGSLTWSSSSARASCCGRCGPTTGTRGARCASAAASGSSDGSRGPSRAAPTRRPSARRSAPAAARGSGSATSTPRTGSACSSPTARFAGEVSLGSVQRGPFQMAYIGYWIDEALAGRGYVPEGVVLIMRYAFETLALHRLEAAIVPRNTPSRRVAEKLGLRDEGIATGFLQIQGVFEDHVRYAITVEEWEERGPELVARYLTPQRAAGTVISRLRPVEPALGEGPGLALDLGGERGVEARLPRHLAQRLLGARRQRLRDARRARPRARVPRGATRRRRGSSTRGRSRPRGRRRRAHRTARSRRRPAGRRPVRASTCARRRGAGRSAGSGRRTGPMSPARRTSHASARFMPAPTAGPLTAAMVGSGERSTRRNPS